MIKKGEVLWGLLLLALFSSLTAKARMRQNLAMFGGREYGFMVCDANGLYRGPESVGGPLSVSITPRCPQGGRPKAIFHTHPGGVPVPSPTDFSEAQRLRIPVLCIGVPETGVIKCHLVPKSRRQQ